MCACVCVCVCVREYFKKYVYIYIYIYICIYIYLHTYVCIYIYLHMYVCIYITSWSPFSLQTYIVDGDIREGMCACVWHDVCASTIMCSDEYVRFARASEKESGACRVYVTQSMYVI